MNTSLGNAFSFRKDVNVQWTSNPFFIELCKDLHSCKYVGFLPKNPIVLKSSVSLSGSSLNEAMKITALNYSNNALAQQKPLHHGYLTRQIPIISVCLVVVQFTTLQKAPVHMSISTPNVKMNHVKVSA